MKTNIILKYGKIPSSDSRLEFKPTFYDLTKTGAWEKLEDLIHGNANIQVHDTIVSQCEELLRIRTIGKSMSEESKREAIAELTGSDSDLFGLWVYYPWSSTLVHVLSEKEYVEVRTSRNQTKISRSEQVHLSTKKIGIIGLSVGQSIAITCTMERIYGEIRLADFDSLELSNLNRIRSGIASIGLSKVLMAAREIAEIDPYLNVVPYFEGITADNVEEFMTNGGNLDLLIEECDSLDVKILSRQTAKKLRIPVIMETNDRGMLDIERFDNEPDRPIMHGLIAHLPELSIADLKLLSAKERMNYLAPMISIDTISQKLKQAMSEIGRSIVTWPQLASSVMLGAGIAGDTARRILLSELTISGRFYIDLNDIISMPVDNHD